MATQSVSKDELLCQILRKLEADSFATNSVLQPNSF